MDKGFLSNLASALVLTLGLGLEESDLQSYILYAGMFALSGGVTNSLAVKMLFDRIPGLVGSGVIPARFREIREKIRRLIMENFFAEEYLRDFFARNRARIDWKRYVRASPGREGPVRMFVERQWEKLTAPESLRPVVSAQVEKLMDSTFGGFLHVVGRDTVEALVSEFILSFAGETRERVLDASSSFDTDDAPLHVELDEDRIIEDIQKHVDELLAQKLEELDSRQVKRMMEDVIRHHLGWLVVWGNVFGGLLGIAARWISR